MIEGSPEWAIERLRDPVFASAHIRESMRRQSEVERIGLAGGGSWSRETRPRVDTHPTQLKLRWEVKP